ncbi:MAG: hypothetical protein Q9218_003055 [Villophora microphyllina]
MKNGSSLESANGRNTWTSILGLTYAISLAVKRSVVSRTLADYHATNEKYIVNTAVQELLTCALIKTASAVAEGEDDLQTVSAANIRATAEPKRRRRQIDDEEDDEAEPVLRETKKRRRHDDDDDGDNADEQNQREDLSAQVKRLRKELREKDERLRRLEQTVELLTRRNG